MKGLTILTIIVTIAIILLSFISKGLEKKILFPTVFVFISIGLFFTSLIIGRWEGIGLGAISASLFVASIIAFIAIVLLDKVRSDTFKK